MTEQAIERGLRPIGTLQEQNDWLRQQWSHEQALHQHTHAELLRRLRELQGYKQEAKRLRQALEAFQTRNPTRQAEAFQASEERAGELWQAAEQARRRTAQLAAQLERQQRGLEAAYRLLTGIPVQQQSRPVRQAAAHLRAGLDTPAAPAEATA